MILICVLLFKKNNMKNYILLLIFIFTAAAAQDKNPSGQKPEPLKEQKKVFDNYEFEKLDCGLKTYFFADRRQPYIKLRLEIFGGKYSDTNNTALAETAASSLLYSHPSMDRDEYFRLLDNSGARFSVDPENDYVAISIEFNKKYTPEFVKIFSGILKSTDIEDEALENAKKELDYSIKGSLTEALARIAAYGPGHPAASMTTQNDVKKISTDDVEGFLREFVTPGNTNLSVTGDFNKVDMVKLLNDNLNGWAGKAFLIKAPEQEPFPEGICFINADNTPSYRVLIAESTLPPADFNNDKLKMAAGVIRQKMLLSPEFSVPGVRVFAYTEQVSNYTNDLLLAGFTAPNGIKPEKLYSELMKIYNDVIKNEQPDSLLKMAAENIYYAKKMLITGYSDLAKEVQNINKEGVVSLQYMYYRDKLNNYTPFDIHDAVSKYLAGHNKYIIAEGGGSLKDFLKSKGSLYEYDRNLNALTGPGVKLEELSLSPEDLIEKYADAIGGYDNINDVMTMTDSCTLDMKFGSQNFKGSYYVANKAPDKMYTEFETPVFSQKIWVNGNKAWMQNTSKVDLLDAATAERFIFEAHLFRYARLLDLGYKCKVLGKMNNEILMSVRSPLGREFTIYYNEGTYLIDKIESRGDKSKPSVTVEKFEDYKKINGVKLPQKIITDTPAYHIITYHKYNVNAPINENITFTP